MPHQRKRHINPILKSALGLSSVVGLLGHRQTGKTTLLESYTSDYATFDNSVDLESAQADPSGFIADRKAPFGIDECQYCPPLFPALKEYVRTNKKRGAFLLSGSVRFTSRKAIQESLTGRILNLELLPFTLSESHSYPLPNKLEKLVSGFMNKKLSESFLERLVMSEPRLAWAKGQFEKSLSLGGLPGICFVREPAHRYRLFETHIETVLNRDLRLLVETTLSLNTLRNLLHVLAQRQGVPVEWSSLRSDTGIGVPTLKRLLSAFESLFLIRTLMTRGGPLKSVYYFEDMGLANHLVKGVFSPYLNLSRGLYTHLREQWTYSDHFHAEPFQYRTRSGALIPLCLDVQGFTLGILPILEKHATLDKVKSAHAYLNANPQGAVILAHSGTEVKVITDKMISFPWSGLVV